MVLKSLGALTAVSLVGGCGSDIPNLAGSVEIPAKFVPVNCNNTLEEAEIKDKVGSPITPPEEAIDKKVCETVNAIGKQTVNNNLENPNLYPNNSDFGGEIDFFLQTNTGPYSEVAYATNSRGEPIYSKPLYTMVGNQSNGMKGDIVIVESSPITQPFTLNGTTVNATGVQWDESTQGQGSPTPTNFDSLTFPEFTGDNLSPLQIEQSDLQLLQMYHQVYVDELLMLHNNH